MDLRQLSYVVAVVDHGGFTRAAAALHVAQPSLSQAVKALETELGVSLFDRLGRSVRLTAAGRALLPGARQALHDVEIAREAVAAVRGVERGRLDLVCLPTLGVSPVGELVGAFRRAHPDVTVRLVEPDEVGAAAGAVVEGEAEIGFVELPVEHEALVVSDLGEQDYVSVHHRSVERGTRVSVRQLADLPLVTTMTGTSTRRLVDEAFGAAGLTPRIAIETDLREVISAVVGAGGGYSILPREVAERMVLRDGAQDVRIARITPPITRRIGVVHRRGELSPAAGAFMRLVGAVR